MIAIGPFVKGELATAGTTAYLTFFNADGAVLGKTLVGGSMWSVAMTPDGSKTVAGCDDGKLYVFNGTTLVASGIPVGADKQLRGVAISDDGQYAAVGGGWFTQSTFVYPAAGSWSAAWTVNVADFDGDGKADVFLYNSGSGQWFECVTTGASSFTYYTSAIRWDANWQLFITDLNGDRKSDVLLYSGRTWVQALNTSLGAWAYGSGAWDTGLTIVATSKRIP